MEVTGRGRLLEPAGCKCRFGHQCILQLWADATLPTGPVPSPPHQASSLHLRAWLRLSRCTPLLQLHDGFSESITTCPPHCPPDFCCPS